MSVPLPVVFIPGYVGPDPVDNAISKLFIPIQAAVIEHTLSHSPASKSLIAKPTLYDRYKAFGYVPYDDLNGTPSGDEMAWKQRSSTFWNSTYADDVDLVTHSTGGLLARAYLASVPDAPVDQLVMVACPNRGTNEAYKQSSD